MRSGLFFGLVSVLLLTEVGFCQDYVEVWYEVNDLGSGRWECTYEVENVGLAEGVEEFTVWFDFGLYDNLLVETSGPLSLGWNEIVVQPEPVLSDDGFYDAVTLADIIEIGESEYGFAVSFDWLGQGQPGSQYYEVVDPVSYETIADGWTVPEPGTIVLFGFGFLLAVRRRADA